MMRPGCMCMVAATWMLAIPARAADEPPLVAATQVASLFMQSCIPFAGDTEGLRGWTTRNGLKTLPADVQGQYLYGLPGQVFDASNKDGKFVLVSEDRGSCSTIAERADGQQVIADLEKDLNEARITFKITGEKGEADGRVLRHREYLASHGQREWLLLVSTVKDPAGGQAILTANRY